MSEDGTHKRAFVFVNGILTNAGAHDGWTDRAVTWTQTRTPYKAEKWEYSTTALMRRLRQQSRAEKIATMLRYYQDAGFEVVLVGHSNGCDIIARVLALRGVEPWHFAGPVRSAHLFAPAADAADFRRALADADLRSLFLYGSANDRALQLGSISRALTGWLGLGYGSMGLLNDVPAGAHVYCDDSFGHSTWFEKGEHFERTMLLLHDRDRDALPSRP